MVRFSHEFLERIKDEVNSESFNSLTDDDKRKSYFAMRVSWEFNSKVILRQIILKIGL